MKMLISKLIQLPVFILAAAILSACGELQSIVEPIVYAKQGGMSPQTEFAMFKDDVNREIARELRGEKPRYGPAWSVYWQDRYDLLRVNMARYNLERQRYIDYLHQLRRHLGLPLYDNEKWPAKYLGNR